MNNGTRAITDQYEQVRSATEQERQRTMDALHGVYQQAIGDSEVMFQSATERFTEIVQSMRQMAAEMQRELDNTRQELRRGILELPQETAETAAQMRRVIVDQIEALAELNRIVARHGREFEVVEPAREPMRRVQDEQPARRAPEEPHPAAGSGRTDAAGSGRTWCRRPSPRGRTTAAATRRAARAPRECAPDRAAAPAAAAPGNARARSGSAAGQSRWSGQLAVRPAQSGLPTGDPATARCRHQAGAPGGAADPTYDRVRSIPSRSTSPA